MIFSVQFLFSKGYCLLNMTGSFVSSCLKLQCGMDWPSLDSTPKSLSTNSKTQPSDLENICENSSAMFAQNKLHTHDREPEMQLNQLLNHQQAHLILQQTQAMIQRNGRTFNLKTYKYHGLGDYVSTIRQHGTVDGYNTQLVILAKFILRYTNSAFAG